MGKLLLLFTVTPIVETYLLVVLGQALGFWPTVGVVLLTGIVGAILAKHEGLKVWRSWSRSLAEGRMPEEGILGGVLVLIGGVLLVTPGVLTDAVGISLLVPPSRRFIAERVRRRLEKRFGESQTMTRYRVDLGGGRYVEHVTRRGASDEGVIDAEGEVLEERRRSEGDT